MSRDLSIIAIVSFDGNICDIFYTPLLRTNFIRLNKLSQLKKYKFHSLFIIRLGKITFFNSPYPHPGENLLTIDFYVVRRWSTRIQTRVSLCLTVTNRECPTARRSWTLHDSVHGTLYSTNRQDRTIGHVRFYD